MIKQIINSDMLCPFTNKECIGTQCPFWRDYTSFPYEMIWCIQIEEKNEKRSSSINA